MAYQTRYTASFLGRDGVQYVVRLLEDGFSGTPIELTATADGASLTWGERGRDVFEPLLASRLEVTLSVPETEALDEALAAATSWWRMELEADGQIVWRGVVVTDTVERELYRPRYRVRLAASDGLGLLADVLYLQSDGTPWSGRAPLVVHLARALSPLGFGMDIAVAVPWLPSQAAGSGCGLDAEVDAAAFARDGRTISCLDVIREICARFNARIYQYGGRWYVTQRALETGSDYQLRIYDASGVFQATETRTGQAMPGGVVMRGTRTFLPAVAALGERYRHGSIPSLIKGGSFEEPGTGGYGQLPQPVPSDLWAEYGTNTQNDFVTLPRGFYSATSAQTLLPEFKAVANRAGFVEAIFHGNTRDPAQVRQAIYNSGRYLEQVGDVVIAGQKLAFFAEVILPYHEGRGRGLYMTYFALNIDGTNWYAKRDGTWAQSSNEADWVQPIMDEGSEWGETGLPLKKSTYPDDWTRIQLFFDAAPATGPVRLRLYGSSDIDGEKRDVKGAVWDNVQLIVVGDESGAAASATDYDVWTQAAGQQLERREALIGQGPTSSVPGALTWGGTLATDWQGGTLGPMSLHQLALESRLRALMRPLEVIHEVWSLTGLEPGRAVVRSGAAYAVHYLKRDLLRAMEEVELVRVRFETGTVFFGSLAAAEGIGVVVGGESAGTVQTISTTVDLSQTYLTGPFAVLQADVAAGLVSQLVVDSVGGIPFLQLPPAGAYIRIVHPVTGTIVDAYVASATLDASGTSATLQVRDVSDTTQNLALAEDFPAGAPVWLSANWTLANIEAKVPRSLWQAKGDLVVGDVNGNPVRLEVGAAGAVLTADPNAPAGVTWGDVVVKSEIKSTITTQAEWELGTMTDTSATADGDLVLGSGPSPALAFDGVDDYATLGLQAFGSVIPCTIEAWVRVLNPNVKGSLLGTFNDGTSRGLDITINSNELNQYAAGKLRIFIRDNGGNYRAFSPTAPTNLSDGNWHHLAVVIESGTSIKVYLDGVELGLTYVGSGTPQTFVNFQYPIYLGAFNNRGPASGFMPIEVDELRFWSAARTQAQIQAYKDVELSGTEQDLYAYFPMNEGSGTATAEVVSSGTAYLQNGVGWTTRTAEASSGAWEYVFDVSGAGTVEGARIEWTATVPSGSSLQVETRVSTDGGATWSVWTPVVSGQTIPDLPSGTDRSALQIGVRITLSKTSGVGPSVHDVAVILQTPLRSVESVIKVGQAVVPAAQTSVTVSATVNNPAGIQVTPASGLGNATKWWVTNISATSFDIAVDAAPGADVTFNWMVVDL